MSSSCAVPTIQPAGQATDTQLANTNAPAPPAVQTPVTKTTVIVGVIAGLLGGIGIGWLLFSEPKRPYYPPPAPYDV